SQNAAPGRFVRRVDDDQIFDAEAAEADTIEPRLDGDHVPRPEVGCAGGRLERVVVDQQPDPVPGPQEPPVGVPGVSDEVPAHRGDLAGRYPGAHGRQPGELHADQQVVDLALVRGRLADHVAAGHVGVVAVDQPADVDHDRV